MTKRKELKSDDTNYSACAKGKRFGLWNKQSMSWQYRFSFRNEGDARSYCKIYGCSDSVIVVECIPNFPEPKKPYENNLII